MAADLYFKKYGESGRNLVILHGLFGSSKNWITFAKSLSRLMTVYVPDLRNHGESPHMQTHTLNDLREDLKVFLEKHRIENPVILGHSMGGFAAMALVLKNPEMAAAVIIEDIAPKNYLPAHRNQFESLKIKLDSMSSRSQIDEAMREFVKNKAIRQFLQMNLSHENGVYRWKLNVPVLENSGFIGEFSDFDGLSYKGNSLFVTGGLSGYVSEKDHTEIYKFFPAAEILNLKDADHWLHYSKFKEFDNAVKTFLKKHGLIDHRTGS
ncbi:MAG: alpha/beta fold hydrolase [Spirochaetia bacterium]|nr:alpha/beta fold hydrolase [Spirochaetia bacterium]